MSVSARLCDSMQGSRLSSLRNLQAVLDFFKSLAQYNELPTGRSLPMLHDI